MSDPKQYLVRGTLHKLAGVLVKSASPVLTVLLAHFFSQETFGQYVSLQLMALTLSRLALLGLDKGIAWHIPQNLRAHRPLGHQLGPVLGTALKSSLVVTTGAFLVAFLLLRSGVGGLSAVSPWFAFLCFAATPFLTVIHYSGTALEGVFQPKYRVWIGEFLLYATVPPLALLLRFSGLGESALPLAFLLSAMLCAALLLWCTARHYPRGSLSLHGRLDRAILRYSWPQGVADFTSSILLRLDLWMVLFFLGPEWSAVYAVMLTLSNAVKTIRQNFDSLLLPVISSLGQEQGQGIRSAFGFTVGLVSILQYFIALAILFFPGEIMAVAGREYALQLQALLLLLLGNLVSGFFGLNASVLAGLGKSHLLMRISVATLVVNFGLNLYAIPRFGLAGAALASVTAVVFQGLAFLVLQVRASGVRLYRPVLWVQCGWIAAFGLGAFLLFPILEGLSVTTRALGFVIATAVYGMFAGVLYRRTSLARNGF